MKNYSESAALAGIGRTPRLCRDALAEMLEELFDGKKFSGQEGRKALKIYKQDLPIPDDNDVDSDADTACAPYVVVKMAGGDIEKENEPQKIDFELIICAYDEGRDRAGMQDVGNIKEDIVQQICTVPYFGGIFTILKPIIWALQQDDTYPYYFGAVKFSCTAPAMLCGKGLEELI